ncbi:lysine--tRNA ligase [archaeon]|nr:MAG: lysine--tRNA ligase [archaeon]
MEIIGKGTWLDSIAKKVIDRDISLNRDLSLIRVESGLGASGFPHIGSLSDAIRAYGIKLALENLGYNSELIAFSDDLDGLRKVPKGIPKHFERYIGHPVSRIPDPFGCHSSYGEHMSSLLLEALDRCGAEYVFKSASETYKRGELKEQVWRILSRSEQVGEAIRNLVSQEKYTQLLPYFPICKRCGRLYVAEAYKFLPKERKVLYRCKGIKISGKFIEGCGHEGEVSIDTDEGKLPWKVDLAARWASFDIRFEAYGKDLIDSIKVNDWVSENILGFPPPLHVVYELFLDRSGKKISKSAGSVLTPQLWFRYGSPQSLILLMYKRIIGTRYVSVDDIPNYMDELDRLEDIYFDRVKISNRMKLIRLKGLYEYVHFLNPPKSPSPHIPYRLLTLLVSVAPPENLIEFVYSRLSKYKLVEGRHPEVDRRINYAQNWVKDFGGFKPTEVTLSPEEVSAVRDLINMLNTVKSPEELQSNIFEVARRNNIKPRNFFRLLYKIIIGRESGPRLGPYMFDVGRAKVIDILKAQLIRYESGNS